MASDNRMLKLASPLGDEAAAAQIVEAAIARIARMAEVAGAATGRPVILQTLADDPDAVQFNMDLGLPGSPRYLTGEFNRRLARQARQDSRLVLDVNALASLVGQSAWSAGRYWYAAKYPFATAMIPLYADNVMRILAAQMGRSRRVLVLDLDNTMWGGIVGDDGIEGLALGNGSALGRSPFGAAADGAVAEGARHHPVRLLEERRGHRARRVPQSSRNDPEGGRHRRLPGQLGGQGGQHQGDIAEAIDLGLDSFVFLDDNPAERKRVRDALPSVAVPELPGRSERLAAGVSGRGIFRAGRLFERGPAAGGLLQGQRAARRPAGADRRS